MDDVTALRDALVNDAIWVNANTPKNVGEWRARLDALIAAACAGLVEALAATDSVPPPWSGTDGLVDAWHARGKAIRSALAALHRPEEPQVERKVAKDIDAAVDELERLFHPEGRCAMCGGGRPYWKHDMGTYSDHPEGHPFAAEAR